MAHLAIIEASARSNGDTRKLTDYLLQGQPQWQRFDLNQLQIGHYDYHFQNQDDDFLPTIRQLLKFPVLLLASPVYWYTMSGRMKVFLDRISDLLDDPNKDLGRQLRGKTMVSLSCSQDPQLTEGFEIPLRETAQYLGMDYGGHFHGWIQSGNIAPAALPNLERLMTLLKELC